MVLPDEERLRVSRRNLRFFTSVKMIWMPFPFPKNDNHLGVSASVIFLKHVRLEHFANTDPATPASAYFAD
jgi:hypothetical protein